MLECSGVQGCCSSPPPAEADEGALQKLFEAVKNPGPRKHVLSRQSATLAKGRLLLDSCHAAAAKVLFINLNHAKLGLVKNCQLLSPGLAVSSSPSAASSKSANASTSLQPYCLSVENVEGNSATWRKPSQVDLQNTESQVSSSSHLCVVGRSFICWHGTTRPPKLLQVRVNGPHLCKCILSVLQPIR